MKRLPLALLELMFGCSHRNLSRAFTLSGRTYKVCCDCGAEFDYSLETMSVVRRRRARSVVPQVPRAVSAS